ncbi:Unknown protein [Striga hermonthica]|uniref:Myb/SANT-like domain-containing protein n=1 Tax=Striga hermonthica TaxID=68872 RepID=A0A9N7R1Z2_STRHE|nr:Unknown protein [Striga hermonthica]
MSFSGGIGPSSESTQGDAKWPPENEAAFVSVLLDEVLMGNRVTGKFTPNQWTTILAKLKEQCPIFYPYKVTQLQSKYQRMKVYWRKFHNMVTNATGLSWDPQKKMITGDADCFTKWTTANPSYHDMEGKVCVHYEALTTIFHGTTATGSKARASTQRVPEGRGEPSGNFSPDVCTQQEEDPMETPTSHRRHGGQNRSVRRRRSTESSFDTAMYSWSDLNVSLKERNNKPAKLTTMEHAMRDLQEMPNMDEDLFQFVCTKLRDPTNRAMFVAITSDERRQHIINMWINEGPDPQ